MLTKNRDLNRYLDQELRLFPVKGGVEIFHHALVGVDAETGYVRPFVAGDRFAGIAYEQVNNPGIDGDANIRLFVQGDFILPFSRSDVTMNASGSNVLAMNDETVLAENSYFLDGSPYPRPCSFVGVLICSCKGMPGPTGSTNKAIVRILPWT